MSSRDEREEDSFDEQHLSQEIENEMEIMVTNWHILSSSSCMYGYINPANSL